MASKTETHVTVTLPSIKREVTALCTALNTNEKAAGTVGDKLVAVAKKLNADTLDSGIKMVSDAITATLTEQSAKATKSYIARVLRALVNDGVKFPAGTSYRQMYSQICAIGAGASTRTGKGGVPSHRTPAKQPEPVKTPGVAAVPSPNVEVTKMVENKDKFALAMTDMYRAAHTDAALYDALMMAYQHAALFKEWGAALVEKTTGRKQRARKAAKAA